MVGKLFQTRRKCGDSVVQTIATRSQNGRRGGFLKLVDSHRRALYQPPWIVEVHALLSSGGSLCLGSCRYFNHRLHDLACLPPTPARRRVISFRVLPARRERARSGVAHFSGTAVSLEVVCPRYAKWTFRDNRRLPNTRSRCSVLLRSRKNAYRSLRSFHDSHGAVSWEQDAIAMSGQIKRKSGG